TRIRGSISGYRPEYRQHLEPHEPEESIAKVRPQPIEADTRSPVLDERHRKPDEEEREQGAMNELRDSILSRAEERVGDVASIELAHGEEVDHRDEHATPGAERDRREEQVFAVRDRRSESVIQELDGERLAQLGGRARELLHLRVV